MFLSDLTKEQSKYFLELAYIGMMANGEMKVEELEVFEAFKYETHMSDFVVQNIQLDDILHYFKNESKVIRNKVLIEFFGILYSDKNICESEEVIIQKLQDSWELPRDYVDQCRFWVKDFTRLFQEAYDLIEAE